MYLGKAKKQALGNIKSGVGSVARGIESGLSSPGLPEIGSAVSRGLGSPPGLEEAIGFLVNKAAEAATSDEDLQAIARVSMTLAPLALGAKGALGARGAAMPPPPLGATPKAPMSGPPAAPRPPKLVAPELPPGAPGKPPSMSGTVDLPRPMAPGSELGRTLDLPQPMPSGSSALIQNVPLRPPPPLGATPKAPMSGPLGPSGTIADSASSMRTMPGQPPSMLDFKTGTLPDRPASMLGGSSMRPKQPAPPAPSDLPPVVPQPMSMAHPPAGAGFVPPRRLEALGRLNDQFPSMPPPPGAPPSAGAPAGSRSGLGMLGAGMALGGGLGAGSILADKVMGPPRPAQSAVEALAPPLRAQPGPPPVSGEDGPDPMDVIESPEQLIEALRSGSFGIQKGDTLSGLAQASGQKWTPELGQQIMAMNPGRFGSEQDMDLIRAGERLNLPFEPRRPKPPAPGRSLRSGPASRTPQPGP